MTWNDILNQGFAIAAVIVLVTAIYWFALWMKEKIVEPVTKSHVDLIEALKDHLPKQADAVNKMLENQAMVIELLKKREEKG